MSIQAVAWVLDFSQSIHCPRLVLISIASHADKYGRNAWPSLTTIAEDAKVDRSHVPEHLAELVRIGELQVESGAGPHGCNVYSLPKMLVAQGNQGGFPPQPEVVAPRSQTSCGGQPESSLTVLEPSSNDTELKFPKPQKRSKGRWTTRLDRRESRPAPQFIDFDEERAKRKKAREEREAQEYADMFKRVAAKYAPKVGGPARKETDGKGH